MVDPAAASATGASPARNTPDDNPTAPTKPNGRVSREQEQDRPEEQVDDDEDDADDISALPTRSTRSPPPVDPPTAALRQRRSGNLRAPSPLSPSPLATGQRRSSSFASQTSAASSLHSRDSFFAPGAPATAAELHADHEPSAWQSAPLLLAIAPAVLGVAFKKGSILLTDLALLALAAVYLNWCLVTPWSWYREAREVIVDEDEGFVDGEGDAGAEEAVADDLAEAAADAVNDATTPTRSPNSAAHELRLHELAALATTFIGPLAGAYLLHMIRTSLSSFGDELVSNLHLTLFVLGAELRPARHAVKLVHARTLHLQRRVRADALPRTKNDEVSTQLSALQSRITELEALASAEPHSANGMSNGKSPAPPSEDAVDASGIPLATIETVKKAQSALQAQIDGLTRAVRRYEKRATAQTLATEGTLGALDARLKDALALAAAAARESQRPGIVENVVGVLRMPFVAVAAAVRVPLEYAVRGLVRALEMVGFVRKGERRRVLRRPVGRKGERERIVAGTVGSGRALK